MPAPHAAVARWSQLWSADHGRLVGELYATDAVRLDLTRPDAPPVRGRDALLADEQRLYRLVPDHRADTRRVLVDGATRCVVEAVVHGTSSSDVATMAAPALWWWELDGGGRIRREWRWLDWDGRRLDDGRVGTGVPDHQPPGTEARSQGWYRDLATRLAETWSWDPSLMVRSLFADDCIVGPVDRPEHRTSGLAELEAAETARLARLARPHRRMDILDVLGEGCALAVRYAVEGRPRPGAAAERDEAVLVATLDAKDRIASARLYGTGVAVVPLAAAS